MINWYIRWSTGLNDDLLVYTVICWFLIYWYILQSIGFSSTGKYRDLLISTMIFWFLIYWFLLWSIGFYCDPLWSTVIYCCLCGDLLVCTIIYWFLIYWFLLWFIGFYCDLLVSTALVPHIDHPHAVSAAEVEEHGRLVEVCQHGHVLHHVKLGWVHGLELVLLGDHKLHTHTQPWESPARLISSNISYLVKYLVSLLTS